MVWGASEHPFIEAKHKRKSKEEKNKGMLLWKVPHCSFNFVALLSLLAKRLSIMFLFSNCSKRQSRMAPDCLIFAPVHVTLLPKIAVIYVPIPVKKYNTKCSSTENLLKKSVQSAVENAYRLYKPLPITATILAVIDIS